MSIRGRVAAVALALAATGGIALATRCLSASQARCSVAALTGTAPSLDVPYAATRQAAVTAMLDLAAVRAGEHLVDLGTGDGRIAIAAARRGATAHGVDIDPVLVTEARANARSAGVGTRATFATEDLFRTDIARADVLALFLLPEINARLRPRILATMRPGARVVSHAFDMGDWSPDDVVRVGGDRLYLWRVPAQVAGRWRLRRGDRPDDDPGAVLVLRQHYQDLGGELDGTILTRPTLSGTAIAFAAGADRYAGRVEGDAIVGTTPEGWRATRVR